MLMRHSLTGLTRVGLSAAVIALLAQIAVPLPSGVALTLQTFAVALVGRLLGARQGTLAAAVYVAVGCAGLPVFAGLRGGFAVLAGPSGGFLWGFLALAACSGVGKGRVARCVLPAVGLVLCHLAGSVQYAVVAGLPLGAAAAAVSLPYAVKDAVSVVLALTLAGRIAPRLLPVYRGKA